MLRVSGVKEQFTKRPERIIGSAAIATLLAGLPLAFAFAVFAWLTDSPANDQLSPSAKEILHGALLLSGFSFVLAGIYALPLLFLLRLVGAAGPASAVLIGVLPAGTAFWERNFPFGLVVLTVGLAVSLLFCRFAYSR